MTSTRLRRCRTLRAALVVFAAAVAGGGTAATADVGAQADPKCQSIDLGIHYAGGQGATAMALDYFQFINVSHRECHLLGYPGVAVYDRAGRRLHVKVSRLNADARRVRLPPGGHVIFTLVTAEERAPGQHCAFGVRERFTPPNDVGTLSIKHRLMICSGMSISSVRAPTPGSRF